MIHKKTVVSLLREKDHMIEGGKSFSCKTTGGIFLLLDQKILVCELLQLLLKLSGFMSAEETYAHIKIN